jgi:uncharacterized protein YbjT (DUF2867 family)
MKLLIAGGNGYVGTRLADRLRALGHNVTAGSRATGFDAVTGAGLGDAMRGVDVVVDVLNTADIDAAAATAFFRGTTERILAAEKSTGVRHHVLLSIVGADRALANGYYAGKVAQEDAVKNSDVPFTIVRATQFYSFVPTIADWLTVDGTVAAPGMLLQPVDVADVVDVLAEVALGTPAEDTIDIAGPERFRLDDLLRATLTSRGDPRPVVTIEGTALGADATDSLVPLGVHRTGTRPYPVAVAAVAR